MNHKPLHLVATLAVGLAWLAANLLAVILPLLTTGSLLYGAWRLIFD